MVERDYEWLENRLERWSLWLDSPTGGSGSSGSVVWLHERTGGGNRTPAPPALNDEAIATDQAIAGLPGIYHDAVWAEYRWHGSKAEKCAKLNISGNTYRYRLRGGYAFLARALGVRHDCG